MPRLSIGSSTQQYYDAYYQGESEWRWLSSLGKARNIARLCRSIPHETILDIGAGEGSVLKRLSDMHFGSTLFALEVSASGAKVTAQRSVPRLAGCVLYDGYDIPFGARTFDLAILSHLVEHLEFPRKLLQEASKVAKHLFIEVPLEDTLRMTADFREDRSGHINFYSWKTVRRLVQTSGLEIIAHSITNPSLASHRFRHGRTGLVRYMAKEIPLRLLPRVAVLFFGYHCSLLCRPIGSHPMAQADMVGDASK